MARVLRKNVIPKGRKAGGGVIARQALHKIRSNDENTDREPKQPGEIGPGGGKEQIEKKSSAKPSQRPGVT